ncbi:MAG: metal resistance protein [Planctomycetota bacterium]|nr:MAG: metal resistance protein [Planctomycetota bacterium]
MGKHNSHKQIINRLKRARGHLDHVIKMIEDEKPCVDVAQQIHAVNKAVLNAKQTLIKDHIDHCLDPDHFKNKQSIKDSIEEFKEITKYLS